MTPDLVDLARRAVACPRWRWLPGMRTTDAIRVVHNQPLYPAPPRPLRDALPDLTDPATLGCLLALVRSAYEDDFIGLEYDAPLGKWGAYAAEKGVWSTRLRGEGNTEAEALVVALEAAP